jgi:hypothetical protein
MTRKWRVASQRCRDDSLIRYHSIPGFARHVRDASEAVREVGIDDFRVATEQLLVHLDHRPLGRDGRRIGPGGIVIGAEHHSVRTAHLNGGPRSDCVEPHAVDQNGRILFNENVSYGYRRNLFALLNLGVVLICIWAVLGGGPFAALGALKSRITVVFVVAAIHAIYIGLAVNQRSVCEAAKSYARQLILSCESLLGEKPVVPKPKRAGRGTGDAAL